MLTLAGPLLISLLWLAHGVLLVAAPGWWRERLVRAMADPFTRFLILQGTGLSGVFLLLASAEPPRDWFWVTIGAIVTLKGLVLLGLRETTRNRVMQWWQAWPDWSLRVSGFLVVTLAMLLAVHGWSRG
ncbi:MAG: hypothetical protein ACKOBZ_08865 [Nitrospira sp.]|nr:hypothetical protein [Nitrospira sp.]